jgi:hypothetical protein
MLSDIEVLDQPDTNYWTEEQASELSATNIKESFANWGSD